MKLDLSKFKKVKESKSEAVLKHPAGHHIRIAKNVLSPQMQEDLGKLPLHFDVGGAVPGEGSDAPAPAPIIEEAPDQQIAGFEGPSGAPTFNPYQYAIQSPDAPVDAKINAGKEMMAEEKAKDDISSKNSLKQSEEFQKALEYNQFAAKHNLPLAKLPAVPANYGVKSADLSEDTSPMPAAMEAPPAPPAPPAPQAIAPNGMPQMSGNVAQDVKQGTQGTINALGEQAKAEGQLGQMQAGIYNKSANDQQKLIDDYQVKSQANMGEIENAIKDYKAQDINPNHWWDSKTTGDKIGTAVGLLLSGLGGNNANDYIQKQIENDVNAQVKNMDKRHNVVGAYMDQFKNINAATNMASAMQYRLVAEKINEAAAKMQNPIAMAKAKVQANQYMAQSAQLVHQATMQQMMMDQMNKSGPGGMSPEQRIAMLSQNPAEAEAAGKELASIKNHSVQRDKILSAFDAADKTNTIAGRAGKLGFEPADVGVLQSLMMPYLKDAEGRINEQELVRTDKLIPRPGDSPEKIKVKLAGLKSFLEEKTPVGVLLPKYGIDASQFGRRDESGNRKIKLGPPQVAGR